MTRSSTVSKKIYKEHLKFYRFINDEFIFLKLMIPLVETEAKKIHTYSKGELKFKVPKKGKETFSKRRKSDILRLINDQISRDIFAKSIIALVSRMESHIQKCMYYVIKSYPKKLSILAGDKITIPLEKLLNSPTKEWFLENYIEQKCSEIIFESPKDYIQKLEAVLSIVIPKDLVGYYIEIKATRDIIVHGESIINDLYKRKSASYSRGEIGAILPLNKEYYEHTITTLKKIAGTVVREIEHTYQ
jgi:hypothetical protein